MMVEGIMAEGKMAEGIMAMRGKLQGEIFLRGKW
jgi:hypothetical protein